MKTVYCVQYTINSGHHNSYANLYCEMFLEMGYKVVLLTPQERQDFSTQLADYQKQELFFPITIANIDNSINIMQESQATGCHQRSWMKALFDDILGPWLSPCRKLKYQLCFLISFFRDCISGYKKYGGPVWPNTLHLKAVTRVTRLKPDFLFFLYIDDYLSAYPQILTEVCVPWAGILFYTEFLENYSYPLYVAVKSSSCYGLCMLEKRKIDAFSKKFPAKKFVALPDVSFYELPRIPSFLCTTIQEHSGGRPIVLLAGALSKRKGIITLLQAALLQAAHSLYFVICGKIYWETFTGEEQVFLKNLVNNPTGNIFLHFEYIKNEADLNALCALSDIIYAVYEGFDGSSGMLSKAAFFQKPIMVAAGSLMAKDVLAGPMGEVLVPCNVQQIIPAVQRIIANRDNYFFEAYNENNTRYRLLKCLHSYLP